VARVPLYSWVELRVDDTGVKLVTDKATHLSTDGGRTFAPIPGAGGFEPGPGLPDGTPPRYPWRRDNYYTVSRAEDGCTLELHAGRTTTVVDRGGSELECTLSGADNGRFVILLFGNRLLRVGARGTERLGVVPVIPKDFTPDFRGRAIVLDDESGKLTRYARCAPPVVLLGDPK
jgi:hypothetical protein